MSKEIKAEKKTDSVVELKARVYDLIALREQATAEINQITQLIREKLQAKEQ